MTDIRDEPPITYATAFVYLLIRIYNLRVTYRHQELLQMSEDGSGAFKTTNLHPYIARLLHMHTSHNCVYCQHLSLEVTPAPEH